jgi:hypothetical protein
MFYLLFFLTPKSMRRIEFGFWGPSSEEFDQDRSSSGYWFHRRPHPHWDIEPVVDIMS